MDRVRPPALDKARPCLRTPVALAALVLALWLQPASATGLIDAWRAAQQHDPRRLV